MKKLSTKELHSVTGGNGLFAAFAAAPFTSLSLVGATAVVAIFLKDAFLCESNSYNGLKTYGSICKNKIFGLFSSVKSFLGFGAKAATPATPATPAV